jgi:hypothetical protein
MDKRKIIIKEIEYWRKNKLLPGQYCDFLYNLYQDGSDETGTTKEISKSIIRNSHWKFWILICIGISALAFIVFNFNFFPIQMQIGVSVLFISIFYLLGFLNREKSKVVTYICLGSASIFLLFIGRYIMSLHRVDDAFWVLGYLVLCSVVWIVMGIAVRIGLLQFCGWAGLVLFYGWILHGRIDQIHWLQIQMFWIPLTIIFIWLGWLLHHRNKSLGNVYFLVGILLWFVPDVYLIFISDQTDQWMQVSFVGKLMIAGIILYLLRKKWTEWVA